jgi:hypothetical protein
MSKHTCAPSHPRRMSECIVSRWLCFPGLFTGKGMETDGWKLWNHHWCDDSLNPLQLLNKFDQLIGIYRFDK